MFAKLDCGATNDSKRLAMSLGIKALPTFHIYKGGKLVDTMTGAKVRVRSRPWGCIVSDA